MTTTAAARGARPALRARMGTLAPSVRAFLSTEAGSAVALLAATVLALVWANSPWRDGYTAFWHTPAGVFLGDAGLKLDLQHWVNDAAMALFFAVVGLEINREVTRGELRDPRTVAVPALGALGGLLVPVAIFLLVEGAARPRTGGAWSCRRTRRSSSACSRCSGRAAPTGCVCSC
nr:Na+/H+ antiporter NhaA [Cellulomonas sp. JZ18]